MPHKKRSRFDKSLSDLELRFYSRVLKNDMLHYGYFADPHIRPETISLEQIEQAQIRHSENIIEQIVDRLHPVLDVGCGMGGLAALLVKNQFTVEVLTPNKSQAEYVTARHRGVTCHHTKLEAFESVTRFGTIINSESLQYIVLNRAFSQVDRLLVPGGRWIVVDYFKLKNNRIDRKNHFFEDFAEKVRESRWTIVQERDITAHVLPMLAFANMCVDRFLLPASEFAFAKLRHKRPWLHLLTRGVRGHFERKFERRRAQIDVERFVTERKYVFWVIDKPAEA